MDFYVEWISKKNTGEEKIFIERFLNGDQDSVSVFKNGNEGDLGTAISVVNSIPIETYISLIDGKKYTDEIEAKQVPQFSDFSDGAYRLPELLEFSPEGMRFEEVGYQLVKSPTEGAGTKYGENHSKLAQIMGLVEISKRPSTVRSTALGKYLIKFMPEDKNDFLRRMVLREYIIQKMISESKDDLLSYRQVVKNLSAATAIRRRNNVRVLLEFVLNNTKEEKRIDNIDWQVEL